MAPSSADVAVRRALGAAIAALCALLVLRGLALLASAVRRALLAPASSVLRGARRWWCGADRLLDDNVDPEVEDLVRKELWERRVQIARLVMPCLCLISARKALVMVRPLLRGAPGGSGAMMQDVSFVLYFAGLAIAVVCPRLFCQRSLPIWLAYLLAMQHLSFSPLVMELREYVTVNQTAGLSGSSALSFVCLRFPVLVSANAALALVSMASMVVAHASDPAVPLSDLLLAEVANLVVKVLVFRFITLLVERGVRREIEARAGACQRSAVSALLGVMCDAVVDLDPHLVMKEHSAKLAGMLMHDSGRSLRGAKLVDLLSDPEDRERFEHLASCASGGELLPAMFGARVRDAIGNSVKTVLYHVPYLSVGGRTHHIVGVREDTNTAAEAAIGGLGTQHILGRVKMPAAVLTEEVSRRLGARRQRRPPRSAGTPSSGGSSGGGEEEFTAEVWANERLGIHRASPGLLRRLGAEDGGGGPGGSLRALLPEDVGERLTRWVEENARRVFVGEAEPFIGAFGELVVDGAQAPWRLEACFPKVHPEIRRRQTYLVGLRLLRPPPLSMGTCRAAPSRTLVCASGRSGVARASL